jgi:hypothetical protein
MGLVCIGSQMEWLWIKYDKMKAHEISAVGYKLLFEMAIANYELFQREEETRQAKRLERWFGLYSN